MTPSPGKFRSALAIAVVLVAMFLAPRLVAAAGMDARRALEERRSGVWLSARGEAVRVLKDDLEGALHQRFVIHNIDLAPRVPMALGDHLEVRGRYEWNAKVGLLHWTHRDPAGKRAGGWIRLGGKTYY